jgi:dolichyl-phosphate-mannose--protein O-mannosyl transferase
MAGMMAVFGEDSFGWRVGSAVFGTLAIIATGILAFELFGSLDLALTAMALLSLENLFLTQSRIAMNDSYLVLFVLLTFICYLRWRKRPASLKYLLLTGLCLGLALATKWTTLYLFIIIAIDLMAKVFFALPIAVWLGETIRLNLWKALKRFDHHHELPNYPFKQHQQTFQLGLIQAIFTEVRPLAFLALGLIPVLVYLASYSQYFLMGYDWSQFVELQKQMWWYHSGLKATHPYQSTPWQWIFDLRPVYMHIDASKPNETAFIYNLGNAVVLYAGLIAVLSQLRRLLCEKSEQNEQIRFLLLAYFMLWVPWLISPRIMLFYHYLPAVPLLCIILARWLDKLRGSQKPMSWWIRGFILGAAALWFIVFYPHNTGLFLKKDLMDSVYFALDSWR